MRFGIVDMTEANKDQPEGCSFCGYKRTELKRIDNGLEVDDKGYGYGFFCAVCLATKGISCYFAPWDFRFDIEQIRIACQLGNVRLDEAAQNQADLQYLRTMINENNNTIAILAQKLKGIEKVISLHEGQLAIKEGLFGPG